MTICACAARGEGLPLPKPPLTSSTLYGIETKVLPQADCTRKLSSVAHGGALPSSHPVSFSYPVCTAPLIALCAGLPLLRMGRIGSWRTQKRRSLMTQRCESSRVAEDTDPTEAAMREHVLTT